MAKNPTSELFSTLKSYFGALTDGDRTPTEVATAFNEWARESAESVKAKIGEEVESTVSKMGFIKREEYEKLVERVAQLEATSGKPAKKAAAKPAAKPAAKKSTPEKKPAKKIVKKASK